MNMSLQNRNTDSFFYGMCLLFPQGQDVAFEPAKLLWLIQRDFLRKFLVKWFSIKMICEQFQFVWECKSLTFKPESLIELWKLFCNLLHVINHIRVACNHFCLGLSLCYNSHCAAESKRNGTMNYL